ncbi:hypothetical protein BT96DRAFT_312794 [Gymnopus androsaceus JB14]|uniref:Uncharacterized protein n=1 Tax=Gymnopus androsaceus JB14 TaxID=1447944 RepID=A0A6A4I6R2_9AGAR|nr:hypothetical protein BT96DRAFT_312794 [Gymnopus androsaceus JB14]
MRMNGNLSELDRHRQRLLPVKVRIQVRRALAIVMYQRNVQEMNIIRFNRVTFNVHPSDLERLTQQFLSLRVQPRLQLARLIPGFRHLLVPLHHRRKLTPGMVRTCRKQWKRHPSMAMLHMHRRTRFPVGQLIPDFLSAIAACFLPLLSLFPRLVLLPPIRFFPLPLPIPLLPHHDFCQYPFPPPLPIPLPSHHQPNIHAQQPSMPSVRN